MPTVTLRGITDTYATQTQPKQASGGTETLHLRTQSGKNVSSYVLVSGIPAGAVVVSAHLLLTLKAAWSGSTTVTTQRVTEAWSPSTLTYNKQPSTTATGQVTQSVSGLAMNSVLDIDVTALVQGFSAGTANYGFNVSSTGTGLQKFYSADAKVSADFKPRLVVEYVTAPAAPTGLRPSGGQVVSVSRPTLTWTYSDVLSAAMSAYQVQVNATDSWGSPSYDSGEVASSVPQHTVTANVPSSFFWRVRVKNASSTDWSDWSASTQAGYVVKSALSITAPVDGGSTADSTPVVEWSFAGTQTAWQVLLTRGAVVLHDTGYQPGADDSWSLNAALSYAAGDVTAEVRVWDDEDRATTPGDPAYTSASSTFGYEPSGSVEGASDLTVMTEAIRPVAVLSWTRSESPDVWKILRDGETIYQVDGGDLPITPGATTYAWTGSANTSASTKTVNGVEVDRNLCTNPGSEVSAAFSANGGSNAPAQSTTHVLSGTYATLLNRGSGSSLIVGRRDVTASLPARTAGYKLKASFGIFVAASYTGSVGIRLSGAGITESSASTHVEVPGVGAWYRIETSGTDSGSGAMNVDVAGGVVGVDIWIDEIKVTYGDASHVHGPYFDGSTPGDPSAYQWTDVTASPMVEHEWSVVATVNGEDAEDQPTAAHTIERLYLWLLDENDPDWWLALADRDQLGLAFGETSEVLYARGSDRGVLVHDSLRGYEGSLSGGVYDGLPGVGGQGARWLRDRVWHTKQYPTRVFRLVVDDLNIPVVLRNVNAVRQSIGATAFSITFEAYQQGQLAWS